MEDAKMKEINKVGLTYKKKTLPSKLTHFVSRVSDMMIFYLSKIFSITDWY